MSRSRRTLNRKWRVLEVRVEKAEALAADRKELLMDVEYEFENCGKCLICQGQLDTLTEKINHYDDCKFGKAIVS